MKEMFMQFIQTQHQQMQNQQVSMWNLENQIGQLADAWKNKLLGKLSSDTHVRRIEDGKECKAVD